MIKPENKTKILINIPEFHSAVQTARKRVRLPSKGLKKFDKIVPFVQSLKTINKSTKYKLIRETERILKKFHLSRGWKFSIWKHIIDGHRLSPGHDIWIETARSGKIPEVKICIGKKISVRQIREWMESGEGSNILHRKLSELPPEPKYIKDVDLRLDVAWYRNHPRGRTLSFGQISDWFTKMIEDEIDSILKVKKRETNDRNKKHLEKELQRLERIQDSLGEQNLKEGFYNLDPLLDRIFQR